MKQTGFFMSVLEMAGIVVLRFRPVPRIWAYWLMGVNLAGLYFIADIEAQIVIAAALIGISMMAFTYQHQGFTRILGVFHAVWIPMFAWMATRLDAIAAQPDLATWLSLLLVTNTICLAIDTADAIRYIRGERSPHYVWANENAGAT